MLHGKATNLVCHCCHVKLFQTTNEVRPHHYHILIHLFLCAQKSFEMPGMNRVGTFCFPEIRLI